MDKEQDIVYRKGRNKEELLAARQKAKKEHLKSYAGAGAFAGFMLFIVIARLAGASRLFTALLGGVGTALGALLGHLEASNAVRDKDDTGVPEHPSTADVGAGRGDEALTNKDSKALPDALDRQRRVRNFVMSENVNYMRLLLLVGIMLAIPGVILLVLFVLSACGIL